MEFGMPWVGHADGQGTAKFAGGHLGFRVAEGHFRSHQVLYSGIDDDPSFLTLSSIGVGTYLGAADDKTDMAASYAIVQSVAEGCNVLDTAPNYRQGRGEATVGRALGALRATGAVERREIFVSTKVGFAPPGLLERLATDGAILPGDVFGTHCLHPAFLDASLDNSLASLGIATIDCLYLHNPAEQQLRPLGRAAFARRLRDAFAFCERAKHDGRIKAYGLATWTSMRVPPDHPGYLCLQEAVALAADAADGENHGLRYVMAPINAQMPEAWTEKWQPLRRRGGVSSAVGGSVRFATLADAAAELGIGLVASAPLLEGKLVESAVLREALAHVSGLAEVQGAGARLLQLGRSAPGVLTVLVGHKRQDTVVENLWLARHEPLSPGAFHEAMGALPLLLKRAASGGMKAI